MAPSSQNDSSRTDGLDSPALPVWPDLDLDRRASNQAIAELGLDIPLSTLLARAQAIKETLQAAARTAGER
ncbi:MAG: hypothetical protein ACRD20_02480 [Terriglobales bacterium]